MDDLDHKIVQLLSENARMPVKDIAQKVSLTSLAVSSRVSIGWSRGYHRRLHSERCATPVPLPVGGAHLCLVGCWPPAPASWR